MYCKNCGAAVVGKYCSCCGQRVRSDVEEVRAIEKRLMKEFIDECTRDPGGILVDGRLYLHHLAQACWLAALMKYQKDPATTPYIEAVNSLDDVKYAARALFKKVKDF